MALAGSAVTAQLLPVARTMCDGKQGGRDRLLLGHIVRHASEPTSGSGHERFDFTLGLMLGNLG